MQKKTRSFIIRFPLPIEFLKLYEQCEEVASFGPIPIRFKVNAFQPAAGTQEQPYVPRYSIISEFAKEKGDKYERIDTKHNLSYPRWKRKRVANRAVRDSESELQRVSTDKSAPNHTRRFQSNVPQLGSEMSIESRI